MKGHRHKIHLFLFMCMLPFTLFGGNVKISKLLTEQMTNPLGLNTATPRFSWMLESDKRNVMQTAYHILVASSPEQLSQDKGDLWDSGKIQSDASQWIGYSGKPLRSNQRCYWKVKCYTTQGETGWSKPALWSIGLLNETDWKGEWIGADRTDSWDETKENRRQLSARYLRKEFALPKAIRQATAYIAGLGLYELYFNGTKVTGRVLTPLPTDYRKSIIYDTYDVTPLLSKQNAVGVTLGNGKFYASRDFGHVTTFGYPKVRFCLLVEYTDGTQETIQSDTSWRLTTDGPIRRNNEYDGETYDARKEFTNWTKTGFQDSSWQQASRVESPGGELIGTTSPGMKIVDKVKPVSITKKGDHYILDMGQNMVGWLRTKIRGAEGDSIRLRFAELLKDDGELYLANLRTALVTDVYICNGKETNREWTPRFTYYGFRYVEVYGLKDAKISDFTGEVINDEMEISGSFACSNPTLNQIYKNAFWGIRGNYKGIPLDCPQRDEREPWMGDRATGAWGESFVMNNATLYAKWMRDIRESQDANGSLPNVAPVYWKVISDNLTWPSVLPFACEMLYTHFGNRQPMADSYEAIKSWLLHLHKNYLNHEGVITKDEFGDWCVPPESPHLIHSEDPARKTDPAVLSTAYYIKIAQIMAQFADLLGKQEDKPFWEKQAKAMAEAFNRKFLNASAEKAYYSNNTVTANILPLAFGIVPDEQVDKVVKSLNEVITVTNNSHISCGVIGVQWLMRELSKRGMPDLAFRIATNTTYPSWGYMAEKGATTIWELWNGDTARPDMNSANHVMLLGDLLIWCYEDLAGIQTDRRKVAFKHILMKPDFHIHDLTYVDASYMTPYGKVVSRWKKEGSKIKWYVEIPANTTAEVHLPNGEVKQLGSGKYNI